MSACLFDVEILHTEVLAEIPGAWGASDFSALLDAMDYGDTAGMSDGDLREMCLLSLQGMEPAEAAEIVLRYRFKDSLRSGQIRNAAQEMLTEKQWEHGADMELHANFFQCGSLLHAAFPDDFPAPDAVLVGARVTARDGEGREVLQGVLAPAFVVRLLADGMPESAVLHRLLGDQLATGSFTEAAAIVWDCKQTSLEGGAVRLDVISSGYWFDSLDDVSTFESREPHRE